MTSVVPPSMSLAQQPKTDALELIAYGVDETGLDQYANAIRNAGLAVHAELAANATHLGQLAGTSRYDLVLLSLVPDHAVIAGILHTSAPDVPVILLSGNPGEALDKAIELNARDLVDPSDIGRLVFAVRREFRTAQTRRALSQARCEIREIEHRNTTLFDSSRDAIAYVHEGMHLKANRRYIELFGFTTWNDLEDLPIMDLVEPTEAESFRRSLKALAKQEGAKTIETILRTESGESFATSMECSDTWFDGEPCLQIVIRDRRGQPGLEKDKLIEDVLQADRLRLRFQPIVSLKGDAREHYEIVVKLLDNDGTEILPESYLDPTTKTDLVAEIDRWVIQGSIKELSRQRAEGRKVVFFLTLSRAAIVTESFLLWICDCLREFKANGAWLVFQFRESDISALFEPARRLIDGLRKINCRIAIDQYTGSLSMTELLPQLELDTVKLSPDFTRHLVRNTGQQSKLFQSYLSLERRGLKTVATSIEDANSLAALWRIGVPFVQGHLLQEPIDRIGLAS